MSQSIEFIGVYGNNRKNIVGIHNPQNNRFFNFGEKVMLIENFEKYFEPKMNKFKKVIIKSYVEGHKVYEASMESITLSDMIDAIQLTNHRTILKDSKFEQAYLIDYPTKLGDMVIDTNGVKSIVCKITNSTCITINNEGKKYYKIFK